MTKKNTFINQAIQSMKLEMTIHLQKNKKQTRCKQNEENFIVIYQPNNAMITTFIKFLYYLK